MPVLSEQITVAQPSVSTACSRLTSAFRFTMRLTESANEIVTMAGNPSGTAATARDTPVISICMRGSPRMMPVIVTTAQIPKQPTAIALDSFASRF